MKIKSGFMMAYLLVGLCYMMVQWLLLIMYTFQFAEVRRQLQQYITMQIHYSKYTYCIIRHNGLSMCTSGKDSFMPGLPWPILSSMCGWSVTKHIKKFSWIGSLDVRWTLLIKEKVLERCMVPIDLVITLGHVKCSVEWTYNHFNGLRVEVTEVCDVGNRKGLHRMIWMILRR